MRRHKEAPPGRLRGNSKLQETCGTIPLTCLEPPHDAGVYENTRGERVGKNPPERMTANPRERPG